MSQTLRILSLLPAATEIVYLLGLEKYLVGVSSDCDFPSQIKKIPQVTSSYISNSMSSLQIDETIKSMVHKGMGVFHIDQKMLKELKPNLILTQELCAVCAVGFNQVKKAARILDGEVKIISLEPESVDDILENIRVVGEYTGKKKEARKKILSLRSRMTKISSRIRSNNNPRALVIEWLDPIMVAGHWVSEMVNLAGGINILSKPGEKSNRVAIDQIVACHPEILIISPCGFDIDRTIKEKELIDKIVRAIGDVRVYLIDGNSYMTRPGPRIVDGIEILAEILHPDIFPRKHTKKDWDIINI